LKYSSFVSPHEWGISFLLKVAALNVNPKGHPQSSHGLLSYTMAPQSSSVHDIKKNMFMDIEQVKL
jgi:hypothetical protein